MFASWSATPITKPSLVNEQMPLSSADLLATIVAADAALLCLVLAVWESMIAALGVGSLPNRRRSLSCKVAWILSQVPSLGARL